MNTSPVTREEMDGILKRKRVSLKLIRAFDASAALAGIVLLSPVLLAGAAAVKLSSKGPVLYLQERVGRNRKPFYIRKFRTMVQNADQLGSLVTVSDDARVTKVGKFLRQSKLDELPQLFNVLLGEMALVGPRPEVPYYVERYDEHALQLLRLRPGVTDPASIAFSRESDLLDGSDDVDKVYVEEIMPAKHALNYAYVRSMGFWKNIRILFQTLGKLLK